MVAMLVPYIKSEKARKLLIFSLNSSCLLIVRVADVYLIFCRCLA